MPPKFKRHLDHEDLSSARDSERVMLLSEGSDEEEITSRPAPGTRYSQLADEKIQRVQNEVRGVIEVMQTNIIKVTERGDKLEDLQDRSELLSVNSDAFQKGAKKLKTTIWWKNMKIKLLIVFMIIILFLIIIVPIIVEKSKNSKP